MKYLFYERSNWIKNIYNHPTEEQEKEINVVNAGLHKKINKTYVEFDFLPQSGMFIDLGQFKEIFKLTIQELELIEGDPFHWIREIEIRPDCLVLEFDWDNEDD